MPTFTVQNKSKYKASATRLNTALPFSAVNRVTPAELPMIQRKISCACGGGCPRCQNRMPLKAKLKIGQPNDIYEQEADRVADQVMRMQEPNKKALSDQQSAISNKCETVQMKPG